MGKARQLQADSLEEGSHTAQQEEGEGSAATDVIVSQNEPNVVAATKDTSTRENIFYLHETNKEVRIAFREFQSKFKHVYGDHQKWNNAVYEANFEEFKMQQQQPQDTIEKRSPKPVIGHPPRMIRILCEMFEGGVIKFTPGVYFRTSMTFTLLSPSD